MFIKTQHKDFNKNNQHLHIIGVMIQLDMMHQKIKFRQQNKLKTIKHLMIYLMI